jgi:hypothetical protein
MDKIIFEGGYTILRLGDTNRLTHENWGHCLPLDGRFPLRLMKVGSHLLGVAPAPVVTDIPAGSYVLRGAVGGVFSQLEADEDTIFIRTKGLIALDLAFNSGYLLVSAHLPEGGEPPLEGLDLLPPISVPEWANYPDIFLCTGKDGHHLKGAYMKQEAYDHIDIAATSLMRG